MDAWDYGEGPVIDGRRTVLFCAWLAWSRFRVVLPLWDKSTPSVVMALDRALRPLGGAWHTLESLATLMRRHRADDLVSKAIRGLIRADLIVIDDIGMLPVAPDAAEALFRVVDAAYEKRSIADLEHPPRRVRRAPAQNHRRRNG